MSDFDEASEATEKQREASGGVMDAVKAATGSKLPAADVMGAVNSGLTVKKGIDEIRKGDLSNGVCDAGSGVAGVVSGVAGTVDGIADAAGAKGLAEGAGTVGQVAGTVSGGITAGKGIGEIAKSDGWDDSKRWDGIHDVLTGGADAVGNAGGNSTAGMVGKALGAGLKVGDAIAPTIFGDMKNTGTHYENADKEFHASTGNGAVDWVFGVGDYTNGRW